MEEPLLNGIEIKRFKQAEANQKAAHAFYEVADAGFSAGSPWQAESVYQSLASDSTTVFYAQLKEEIIGFVVAAETPYMLDIYMVVVDKAHQNKKIGRFLLQALLQYAKEKKIPEIILETRKSNHLAIALYERVGFKKISERKAYYSSPIEDAVVMKREIGKEH